MASSKALMIDYFHIRSPHAALNTLLQSAGALVCKQWLLEMDKLFQERKLDVQFHAWVHDEVQLSCPPEEAEARRPSLSGRHARCAGSLQIPLSTRHRFQRRKVMVGDPLMKTSCSSCDYWRTHPVMGSRCQRYPSPITTPGDYICGEYKGGSTPPEATEKEASQGSPQADARATPPSKRSTKAKRATNPTIGKNRRPAKAHPGNQG